MQPPQPLDAASLDAWWTLWHEPWRHTHPGWWRLASDTSSGPSLAAHSATHSATPSGSPADTGQNKSTSGSVPQPASGSRGAAPGGAPDHPPHGSLDLLSLFSRAVTGARLGHRWFCQQFGIDVALPAPRPFPSAVDVALPDLPLAPDDLVAAATALGRVGYASHCLTSSRQGLARLFSHETHSAGDADAWRDALRQARARPLTVAEDHAPPPGGSALELQRWALPLMARLIEDAVPGAWARLRLRFDPQCFTLAPLPPTPYSAALQRQAWRIWRAAAYQQPSLAHETRTAPA